MLWQVRLPTAEDRILSLKDAFWLRTRPRLRADVIVVTSKRVAACNCLGCCFKAIRVLVL